MTTHTRIEEVRAADAAKYAWPRVMCGRSGPNADSTHYLRALPTCPTCMVLRELWLETMSKKKKPTVRRWRAFLKSNPTARAVWRADVDEFPASWRM